MCFENILSHNHRRNDVILKIVFCIGLWDTTLYPEEVVAKYFFRLHANATGSSTKHKSFNLNVDMNRSGFLGVQIGMYI